ncbi:MAG TPA: formate--tetrahydrofolate ligase [Chitinophagaceae bacterium]|nr:formate--tetrahydrofolate ligase [Chitinophagaceae bacterium]
MITASIQPITNLSDTLGLSAAQVTTYGKYKAKISLPSFDEQKIGKSKLIVVTSITPTKAGNGKTTTSIGLADALHCLGKHAMLALREPSLGPVFGMKGGATGAGRSQLIPADEINMHFTGDFHAISAANNTLAALLDNYNYYRQGTPEELKEIYWRRVMDVNDRSLRYIITGLHGGKNGIPAETGFDITPASELMAILCLAKDQDDLRARIDNILLATTAARKPFRVSDLGVGGAIHALLKEALQPNLVQTLEGTPALVHGGPFANIAQGCNSIIATKYAMNLADYVITEAGFGSDLGAEKFFNIKCRTAGITPALSVLVVTTQSLKLHGEVPYAKISSADPEGIVKGMRNLERHLHILRTFDQQVLVVLNRFEFDTDEELDIIRQWCEQRHVPYAVNDAFKQGGVGALEAAEKIVALTAVKPEHVHHTYEFTDPVELKIRKIATTIYGADDIILEKKARLKLKEINIMGYHHFPVCIAKTQYSFTDTPEDIHRYKDFVITVDDLIINSGAKFLVAVCGEMMRMPGLPEKPAALNFI